MAKRLGCWVRLPDGLFRSSKHETSNLPGNLQGKNEVTVMSNILISDLFDFDSLRQAYPERRIKLRFNTSWNTNDQSVHILTKSCMHQQITTGAVASR